MSELEELQAKLALIQGPDGLSAFEVDVANLETQLQKQITLAQGQLQGLGIVKRLLAAHKKHWGLGPSLPEPEVVPETPASQEPNPVEKERLARLAAGNCIHRARGGKWCERKLKTKAEQASGYCETHMHEIGLLTSEKPARGEIGGKPVTERPEPPADACKKRSKKTFRSR